MFSDGQSFIERVILRAHSDLLEDSHNSFVDFLPEKLDAPVGFRYCSCDDVERS